MFGDLYWLLNASRGFVSISWSSCPLTYCRISLHEMLTRNQPMLAGCRWRWTWRTAAIITTVPGATDTACRETTAAAISRAIRRPEMPCAYPVGPASIVRNQPQTPASVRLHSRIRHSKASYSYSAQTTDVVCKGNWGPALIQKSPSVPPPSRMKFTMPCDCLQRSRDHCHRESITFLAYK